jgi:tetratricopeptide (TPR) repeat protein
MTIMAIAHEREGARELAGERLAMAAEVSGGAPQESLRYAQFLMQDGRMALAEDVITDALRRTPDDSELLMALGRIHLARREWPQAQRVAARLRELDDAAAADMATGLEVAVLAGQDRAEETIEALRVLAGAGENAAAMAQLVQAYMESGDLAAAQTYLDEVLAADPANVPGRLMQAGLLAARGETAAAEALYRTLAAEAPGLPEPHQALFALLADQDRLEAAETALAEGVAATGGDAELMFLQAGLLEARHDFEGAIATYETLYAQDSANPLLANNLASLLTTHRSDPESLQRAFAVARRLRNSDQPHFQDTYGWILHRRGDSEQAVVFLEPAAAALHDNAQVQFHLGEALLALDRATEAQARFQRAVDLAATGPEAASPEIAAARARLAEIARAQDATTPANRTAASDG